MWCNIYSAFNIINIYQRVQKSTSRRYKSLIYFKYFITNNTHTHTNKKPAYRLYNTQHTRATYGTFRKSLFFLYSKTNIYFHNDDTTKHTNTHKNMQFFFSSFSSFVCYFICARVLFFCSHVSSSPAHRTCHTCWDFSYIHINIMFVFSFFNARAYIKFSPPPRERERIYATPC